MDGKKITVVYENDGAFMQKMNTVRKQHRSRYSKGLLSV